MKALADPRGSSAPQTDGDPLAEQPAPSPLKDGASPRSRLRAPVEGLTKKASFKLLRLAYLQYGLLKEARTRLKGRRFTCTAFENINDISTVTVNSDGTVTCDCGDVTGEGQFGNILDESIESLISAQTGSRQAPPPALRQVRLSQGNRRHAPACQPAPGSQAPHSFLEH